MKRIIFIQLILIYIFNLYSQIGTFREYKFGIGISGTVSPIPLLMKNTDLKSAIIRPGICADIYLNKSLTIELNYNKQWFNFIGNEFIQFDNYLAPNTSALYSSKCIGTANLVSVLFRLYSYKYGGLAPSGYFVKYGLNFGNMRYKVADFKTEVLGQDNNKLLIEIPSYTKTKSLIFLHLATGNRKYLEKNKNVYFQYSIQYGIPLKVPKYENNQWFFADKVFNTVGSHNYLNFEFTYGISI